MNWVIHFVLRNLPKELNMLITFLIYGDVMM